MNEDKFIYKDGDVIVTIPQCSTCKYNNSTCDKGLDRDDAYKQQCTGYEKED